MESPTRRVFTSADQLTEAVGTELGVSDWLLITRERVDTFADATGDHRHGYLTAALLPALMRQIFAVEARMAVNYGLNTVRFPAPVRVGSSVRASVRLIDATPVGDAVQVLSAVTVEIQGEPEPALVAETVGRFYL